MEKLPLPGYESELDEITSQILQEEEISQEDFKVDSMPELSSSGEERKTFFKIKNFKVKSLSPVKIQFSLPKGTYATVLLREIMKNKFWER